MGLFNASAHERAAAAAELRRVCPRGDLTASYWLHKALGRPSYGPPPVSQRAAALSPVDAQEKEQLALSVHEVGVSSKDALALARGIGV